MVREAGMKKILVILALLFFSSCYSQSVDPQSTKSLSTNSFEGVLDFQDACIVFDSKDASKAVVYMYSEEFYNEKNARVSYLLANNILRNIGLSKFATTANPDVEVWHVMVIKNNQNYQGPVCP